MAYLLANLRTDLRGYTEVGSTVLTDSVVDRIIQNAENGIEELFQQIKMLIMQHQT